jgi:hypothetical protein
MCMCAGGIDVVSTNFKLDFETFLIVIVFFILLLLLFNFQWVTANYSIMSITYQLHVYIQPAYHTRGHTFQSNSCYKACGKKYQRRSLCCGGWLLYIPYTVKYVAISKKCIVTVLQLSYLRSINIFYEWCG